jgi:hypothetical protein
MINKCKWNWTSKAFQLLSWDKNHYHFLNFCQNHTSVCSSWNRSEPVLIYLEKFAFTLVLSFKTLDWLRHSQDCCNNCLLNTASNAKTKQACNKKCKLVLRINKTGIDRFLDCCKNGCYGLYDYSGYYCYCSYHGYCGYFGCFNKIYERINVKLVWV